jgi:V8-like Glu-specific endopeptidase
MILDLILTLICNIFDIVFRDEKNWKHKCGATVITNDHFLTAAHCVESDIEDVKKK